MIDFIKENYLDFFLWFSHAPPIVMILGLGYWAYRRHIFSDVLFLILLSMIVNAFLKCWFQVPLKPHLGQGWYAFPSGHMQFSTVFYGRLWWEFRQRKIAFLAPFLLMGIAWALIEKNYHDLSDVLAGAVVGGVLLVLYAWFKKASLLRHHEEKIGFLLLPLTAVLITFISAPREYIAHVWQAQGGFIGFSLGMIVLRKMHIPEFSFHLEKWWIGGVKILLGFSGFVFLWPTNKFFWGGIGYPGFPLLSFFFLGLWLSAGPDLLIYLNKRILKN